MASPWNIFALDPAFNCGWASTRGLWGVERFKRQPWRHPFAHYLDFRGWLLERIETLQCNALACEGVIASSSFKGNGVRQEWLGVIHSTAAECDLPIVSVMPSSLKKYATGSGLAERPQMRLALREQLGIDLAEDQHDAIAAIWILSWATAEAEEGRLTRDWSGFPGGQRVFGRTAICNRCQQRFEGGLRCPRCGSGQTRLEA